MPRKFLTFAILLVVLIGVFVPTHMTYAWPFDGMVKDLFTGIAMLLMTISSLVLIISGTVFDFVINFTIVDMTKNIGDATGVGGSITTAWATLRDIANMAFIFVLLYAAFKAMFDSNFGNFQTTIRNIIIVALLINFSLFFSKVVIDASNIVSVGFLKSISSSQSTLVNGQMNVANKIGGISGGYMNMLRLQTFFTSDFLTKNSLEPGQILIMGFMSAVFMLITAVILIIACIMFVARFIILVFLMVLSPLALIAYIIPGQSKKFDEWKDALISQSFFAPLYFALTWVVFKLGTSLLAVLDKSGVPGSPAQQWSDITSNPQGITPLLMNYILIIGFSIAALVISKTMASSGATKDAFGAITGTLGINRVAGAVGGVTLGGAAIVGRRSIGAAASRLAQSQRLSNWAGRSWIGQKVKEGTEGVAKSSFDVRQTKGIGGALQKVPGVGSFGAGKAGGFEATLAAKVAKREKVATGLRGDAAKEAYAARISRGRFTRGGSNNSTNTLFGTMGRHNRVVASKILNNQLTPLESNEQNLQNREAQLSQQLAGLQNELATLSALNGGVGPTAGTPQAARLATLNAPGNSRGSVAYTQDQLNTTQARLTNVTAEVTRIRGLINANGLVNTAGVGQPTPGQTQRMAQLQQQLTIVNNGIAATPGGPTPAQAARLNNINTQIAGLQNAMTATIAATQNPNLGVRNAQTGVVRGRRADEQNF